MPEAAPNLTDAGLIVPHHDQLVSPKLEPWLMAKSLEQIGEPPPKTKGGQRSSTEIPAEMSGTPVPRPRNGNTMA